jgi:CMP-N,N'-diacetyllegionaminic acid synthase
MAARRCSLVTRTIVSTDSQEIADVSRAWGAEVPFLRPADLSGSEALVGRVVRHLLKTLEREEKYAPQGLVILFPTHPFRSKEMMNRLMGRLNEGFDEVVTVRRMRMDPMTHFVSRNGGMVSLHGKRAATTCYRRYGLFVGQGLGEGGKGGIYAHELKEAFELVDIDTPEDLAQANAILYNREFIPEWM